ncbi:putative ribonuclease H protein [Glycine max]|nr:putative ribonuclease H protein [Glycine max]
MMRNSGLFEASTKGPYFTWSNKHVTGAIYSRIDRLIGNVQWFQQYQNNTVEVLMPNIFYHAPLKVNSHIQARKRKAVFKFINCTTTDVSYAQIISSTWQQRVEGSTMCQLWRKLRNLQPVLLKLNKQYTNMQEKIQQARIELEQAHANLNSNLFDEHAIKQVKYCTDHLTDLNQREESILMQKSKETWLKLGDGNNSFFHASVKEKNKHKGLYTLTSLTGGLLSTQEEIEHEILDFYSALVGTKTAELRSIDLPAIRNGNTLYLGVPLASKKLTVSQCQPLIEKMLARLKHWSTRLLSYVGRVQLLKSVIFSIANYWMQIFPSPKKVISHINSICSSFMWTGKESLTRKAPVAWDHICNPLSAGGLNMISLLEWNKATIGKLLWNCSWILKAMFKHRDDLLQSDAWKGFQNTGKYVTRKIYHMLREDKPKVTWRKIFYGNLARPRAKFILWMTCLDRLPTKDRLHRFGVVTDCKCVFCGLTETCDHLFFECATTKKVWADILRWISIMRIPGG